MTRRRISSRNEAPASGATAAPGGRMAPISRVPLGRAFLTRALLACLTGLVLPNGLQAQDVVRQSRAAQPVVEGVLDFVNDPSVLRFNGDTRIPRDRTVEGPTALVGGTLQLDGLIQGDVVILNGDLRLGPTAAVIGNVVIVGGELRDGDAAQITGETTIFQRPVSIFRNDDGTVEARGALRERPAPGIFLGGSRFTIRSGEGYNRVEGLPILLGPVVRTSGERPFQLDALAIFRTEQTVSFDNLGYFFRAEQGFGQKPIWRLGGTAYSVVRALRNDRPPSLFRSLSTVLFHEDLQDYHQAEGWSAYLEIAGEEAPARLRLTYRDEDQAVAIPGDPWTLFRQDDLWRPMPITAEGDIQLFEGLLEADFRNRPENASDGWYFRADFQAGLSGSLRRPGYFPDVVGPLAEPAVVDTRFRTVGLDLRRYLRIDPDSDLALRAVYRTALGSETLPGQYQFLLGGVGTLPAYPFFRVDCGARAELVRTAEEEISRPTFPRFGCDGVALFQMEFREEFDFGLDLSSSDPADTRWWPNVDLSLTWHLFLNAGQGWSYADDGIDTGTLADLGAGLSVGNLGFYYAYPLSQDEGSGRFFVRLRRRF